MGKARHGTGGPGTGELRQSVKVGKLNLVDLAGSERVHITGATGDTLQCNACTRSALCQGCRADRIGCPSTWFGQCLMSGPLLQLRRK